MFSWKNLGLAIVFAFFMGGGITHFSNPEFYVAIMPPWIGWHLEIVYISGARNTRSPGHSDSSLATVGRQWALAVSGLCDPSQRSHVAEPGIVSGCTNDIPQCQIGTTGGLTVGYLGEHPNQQAR